MILENWPPTQKNDREKWFDGQNFNQTDRENGFRGQKAEFTVTSSYYQKNRVIIFDIIF